MIADVSAMSTGEAGKNTRKSRRTALCTAAPCLMVLRAWPIDLLVITLPVSASRISDRARAPAPFSRWQVSTTRSESPKGFFAMYSRQRCSAAVPYPALPVLVDHHVPDVILSQIIVVDDHHIADHLLVTEDPERACTGDNTRRPAQGSGPDATRIAPVPPTQLQPECGEKIGFIDLFNVIFCICSSCWCRGLRTYDPPENVWFRTDI